MTKRSLERRIIDCYEVALDIYFVRNEFSVKEVESSKANWKKRKMTTCVFACLLCGASRPRARRIDNHSCHSFFPLLILFFHLIQETENREESNSIQSTGWLFLSTASWYDFISLVYFGLLKSVSLFWLDSLRVHSVCNFDLSCRTTKTN